MFCCPFKKKPHHENKIFIRDFVVEMEIGVNESEKGKKQRVVINVSVVPKTWPSLSRDNIADTVSYDDIVKIIQEISSHGHTHLVETVAEKIAQSCLEALPVRRINVKVEKPDIYGFAVPGVEITRC